MKLKHSIVAAAAVTAALPAGLLSVGAGASIARSAVSPVASAAKAKAPTVVLKKTSKGKVLFAGNGHSLYVFNGDGKNKSNCTTGSCAMAWPPLMAKGHLKVGAGVKASKLGEIKRGKGHQVTYAGHPLYFFSGDVVAGQITGEGSNGFYLVSASGKAVK